ncbi:hypothetical protein Trydic_g5357 [Trypoxylus dichotomus]
MVIDNELKRKNALNRILTPTKLISMLTLILTDIDTDVEADIDINVGVDVDIYAGVDVKVASNTNVDLDIDANVGLWLVVVNDALPLMYKLMFT